MVDFYSPTSGASSTEEQRIADELRRPVQHRPTLRHLLQRQDTVVLSWQRVPGTNDRWTASLVGPQVATYVSGAVSVNLDLPWYYQHHNAAGNFTFRSGGVVPTSADFALTGSFGGVWTVLDRQPFVPPEQPLLASRAWALPEAISCQVRMFVQSNDTPASTTVDLQWTLIAGLPTR